MKKSLKIFISLFIISVISANILKAQESTFNAKKLKPTKNNSINIEATRGNYSDNQIKIPFVSNSSTRNTCDTTNLTAYKTTWTVVDYSVTATPLFSSGFVNGVNTYEDKAKANLFSNTGSNYILGCYIAFSKAYTTTPLTKTVTVNVYPVSGGNPGAPIASKVITMQKIMTDVAGNFFTEVIFDNPVLVTANYYIGVDMSNLNWGTSHDTLSIQSNVDLQTSPSAVWEKQSDLLWYHYTAAGSWNLNISLAIFPFVTDIPANANFTQSAVNICSGYPLLLDASSSNQSSVYWEFQNGNPPNSSIVAPTVTYANAGTNTIKLYILGGGCNNLDSMITNVNVIQSPVPGATSTPTTICSGSSASLQANNGIAYQWLGFPAGQNPITVSPTTNTTYNVTVTGANGCSASQNVTVNVNPIPNPNPIATPSTICVGGSSLLTSTPGMASYLWTPGGSPNAAVSVNPASTTIYTVSVIDGNGCSAIANVTVNVNSSITVTVNNPTICSGEAANLTANGGTSYSWSNGSSTNPTTVSPSSTTSYTVTGTSASCTNTAISTVTVNQSPVVSASSLPTSICNGQTAILTGSGASTYMWNPGSLNGATANVTPSSTTTYSVTGTALGCTGTNTVVVTVNPNPTVTVNSLTICLGSSATLTANGANSYMWSNGYTNNPITVSPTTTTTYTVTGTSLGCDGTSVSIVTVDPCIYINTIETNSSDISIFPNPSYGNFVLDFKNLNFENAEVRVYNYEGRLVLLRTIEKQSGSTEINLSQFAKGIYNIRFVYDKSIITKRVIIY